MAGDGSWWPPVGLVADGLGLGVMQIPDKGHGPHTTRLHTSHPAQGKLVRFKITVLGDQLFYLGREKLHLSKVFSISKWKRCVHAQSTPFQVESDGMEE